VFGLLLLAVALIVYGSLYPWQFDFGRHVDAWQLLLHSWPSAFTRYVARDIALNVLLYVPLGAAAFLSFYQKRRWAAVIAAIALGFTLSGSMELLQAYDDHRNTSLLDLTTNTVGTAAGALLGLVFAPAAEFLSRRTWRLAGAGALLAALWLGFQLYPFFPVFSTYRVRHWLSLPWSLSSISPVEVWAGAAEWFALALALEACLGRLRTWWLAAAILALPLRFFIVTRTVHWNDLLAAPLALVLWEAVAPSRRLRAGLVMMLSAILLRELAPFRWSAAASGFSWVPFMPTLESDWGSAVVIVLRKAFDYGAAVWLLHAERWRYTRAGACVAAALLGLELVQRHLPGRTPETTDAVLALLMALALWLADRPQRRRI
jgi:VanZ family protein